MPDLIEVWKGSDGMTEPEKMYCEQFGWPNLTTTGQEMFRNTHFRTEAEAWDSILSSVRAGVKLAGSRVVDVRATLAQAEKRAADAAIEFTEAHDKYERWLREQEARNA